MMVSPGEHRKKWWQQVLWAFIGEKDNTGDGGAWEAFKKASYGMCDVEQSLQGRK